jgi:hypothetical protein
MTQCEQILDHLKRGKTITPIDALNSYGVFRLAARVNQLRGQGWDILTIRRQNGEKFYAEYQLRTPSHG